MSLRHFTITPEQAEFLSQEYGGRFREQVTVRRIEITDGETEEGAIVVNIDGRQIRFDMSNAPENDTELEEAIAHVIDLITKTVTAEPAVQVAPVRAQRPPQPPRPAPVAPPARATPRPAPPPRTPQPPPGRRR